MLWMPLEHYFTSTVYLVPLVSDLVSDFVGAVPVSTAVSGTTVVEDFLYVFKAALTGRYRRARRATSIFAAGGARPGGGLKSSPSVRTSPPRPRTAQPR